MREFRAGFRVGALVFVAPLFALSGHVWAAAGVVLLCLISMAFIGFRFAGWMFSKDLGREFSLVRLIVFVLLVLATWKKGISGEDVKERSILLRGEARRAKELIRQAESSLPEVVPAMKRLHTDLKFREAEALFREKLREANLREERFTGLRKMALQNHCSSGVDRLLRAGREDEAETCITLASSLLEGGAQYGVRPSIAACLEREEWGNAKQLLSQAVVLKRKADEEAGFLRRISALPPEHQGEPRTRLDLLRVEEHGTREYRKIAHDLEKELVRLEALPRRRSSG